MCICNLQFNYFFRRNYSERGYYVPICNFLQKERKYIPKDLVEEISSAIDPEAQAIQGGSAAF